MATLSFQADPTLAQGYIKLDGVTEATITTSGITTDVTGNLTGNVTGNATTATSATTATKLATTTGSAPVYGCRAWVNFDGTKDTTGAVSTANTNRLIRASGNVASVLRNGTGDYTITFATAMADSNYSVSGSTVGQSSSGAYNSFVRGGFGAYISTSVRIGVWNPNAATNVDSDFVSIQIFA